MRIVMAVSVLSVVLSGTASSLPPSSGLAVPLADAIKAFNEKAANDYIGKNETPITEEEVIAAIRASERPNNPAVSDNLYNAFKQIAKLSRGAYLSFDQASAERLKELLGAIAVYAAGGHRALADYSKSKGGEVLRLTAQLRG